MESSQALSLGSRTSGLSGVGEEVKLCELQYKTKWAVLRGKGWGDE